MSIHVAKGGEGPLFLPGKKTLLLPGRGGGVSKYFGGVGSGSAPVLLHAQTTYMRRVVCAVVPGQG